MSFENSDADHRAGAASSLSARADTLWQSLFPLNGAIRSNLGDGLAGAWVIGQHGGLPVAVVLRSDGRIGYCTAVAMPEDMAWLPRVTYRAGRLSLSGFVNRHVRLTESGELFCPPAQQPILPEILLHCFMENLCKAKPEVPALENYNPDRKPLRLGAAQQMAAAAFKEAIRTAKPEDKAGFADRWADEAFAYVSGKETELRAVNSAAAAALASVRDSNVHRDRRDLVSGALSDCLAASKESVAILESRSSPLIEPYVQACRDSLEAFSFSLEVARSGRATNHKPFSQRLVKGAVLAQATGAVLRMGTVTDALAEVFARRFGDTLPYMQGADVLVAGRDTPDFGVHPAGTRVLSSFVTGRPDATVLDIPHVCIRAAEILLDPRWIAHEFQHVRQELASESRMDDLLGGRDYPDKATELEAKIEECEFIRQFGVLF
jgi:hypothetical protein